MPAIPKPEDDLRQEFRNLGNNLAGAARSAWDSPERKKLMLELENGLNEVAAALRKETETFRSSPTGQQLKTDMEDLQQRIHSGELEGKARQEILNALRRLNTELQKWTSPRAETQPGASGDESSPKA